MHQHGGLSQVLIQGEDMTFRAERTYGEGRYPPAGLGCFRRHSPTSARVVSKSNASAIQCWARQSARDSGGSFERSVEWPALFLYMDRVGGSTLQLHGKKIDEGGGFRGRQLRSFSRCYPTHIKGNFPASSGQDFWSDVFGITARSHLASPTAAG